MDLTATSADRYTSTYIGSRYLYAEWADLIFPGSGSGETTNPGRFYWRVGDLAASWCKATGRDPTRVGDIGGATGRMSFELAQRFTSMTDLLMVEPSAEFCRWARRFLHGEEFDGWVPLPGTSGCPQYRRLEPSLRPAPIKVQVHQATAEGVPRPAGYFDLVTCLNVLDRVADPGRLVHTLGRLVRPSGLLLLASPHHYEEVFTPRERWIDDLCDLLEPDVWEIADRHTDIDYEFLRYDRGSLWYSSQVVGAVRLVGGGPCMDRTGG